MPHTRMSWHTNKSPREATSCLLFSCHKPRWDDSNLAVVTVWPISNTKKEQRKRCRVNSNASMCFQWQTCVGMYVGIWSWCAMSWLCVILQTTWHRITNSWHLESLRMQPEATLAKKTKKPTGLSLLSFYLRTPVCKPIILLYCLYTRRHHGGTVRKRKMSSVGFTCDIYSIAIFT